MTDETLDSLATRFGVTVSSRGETMSWQRDDLRVTTRCDYDLDRPEGRYRAACTAWGVRLGVDRVRCEYDFSQERPDSDGARNVYEMASIYGERLQQLVPTPALELAETIAGVSFFRRPWLDGATGAELVLIREMRRHFHTLAEQDFEALEYDRDNVVEYARYALFYDAYKFRPTRVERHEWGRIKWFATRNGQASSRATLLPDFDYDAARADGAFVLVDRDRFVIAQPEDDREKTLRKLEDAAADALRKTTVPFCPRLFHLTADAIEPGEILAGCDSFDTSGIEPLACTDEDQ
jgi:hypothetical protein